MASEEDNIPLLDNPTIKRKKAASSLDEAKKRKAARAGPPKNQVVLTEEEIMQKYGARTADYYNKHQTSLALARKEVARAANLPNTKDNLDKWKRNFVFGSNKKLNLTKKKIKADEIVASWKAFNVHKGREAQLHLWDSVTALRYKLIDKSPIKAGSFTVIVKSTGEEVEVTADWVKNHFEKDVVQAVMQYSMNTFVPINADIKIPLDTRQVQKIRYFVSGKAGGDTYFEGITSDGMATRLTDEFVKSNLPAEFVSLVVQEGQSQQNKTFFHVPPGAPRTVCGHWMLNDKYPVTKYLQSGESTCLFSSLASALHYLHLEETAGKIALLAPLYAASKMDGIINWSALLISMQEICGWLQPRKLHGSTFDILRDISEYPTVVSLEAIDGGTQHAITVVGRLVFDSNCERALPLSKEALDYCCSTDTKEGAFCKVYKGYRFEEQLGKKKKKLYDLKCKFDIDFFMDVDDDSD